MLQKQKVLLVPEPHDHRQISPHFSSKCERTSSLAVLIALLVVSSVLNPLSIGRIETHGNDQTRLRQIPFQDAILFPYLLVLLTQMVVLFRQQIALSIALDVGADAPFYRRGICGCCRCCSCCSSCVCSYIASPFSTAAASSENQRLRRRCRTLALLQRLLGGAVSGFLLGII